MFKTHGIGEKQKKSFFCDCRCHLHFLVFSFHLVLESLSFLDPFFVFRPQSLIDVLGLAFPLGVLLPGKRLQVSGTRNKFQKQNYEIRMLE